MKLIGLKLNRAQGNTLALTIIIVALTGLMLASYLRLVKAQNYNTALPSSEVSIAGAPAAFGQDLRAAVAQVPEPGPGGVLLMGIQLAFGRRRARG